MTDSTQPPTASDSQPDTHTAAGDDSADDGGPVVLLHVEPDVDSAELLAAFVERFADRFTVRSVDKMAAALDARDAVDCIVTEERLPDGSGVELVEELRARGSDVPVAFHTTCREAETEARAFDAGADAYFVKQPDRGQYDCILERLHELVGGDGAQHTPTATTCSPTGSETVVEPTESEE
ncbi:response regulator [Halorubrum sp. HHNYT27]|uniref:response regulator n=1 Tax=Halorubrum sp. HHNYT27 TaxID=3402275 RepID=UPI003EBCB6B5